jgi:hypothetical protein
MPWPRPDHRFGNPRSTATAQDRKDNSYSNSALYAKLSALPAHDATGGMAECCMVCAA